MNTIAVTDIKRSGAECVSVSVELQSGEQRERHCFVLFEELFARIEVHVGAISSDALRDIEFWSRVTDAYYSAMRSFAFTPSSFAALKVKLVGKGYERTVADQAIEILRERGIVDECDIALRRAEIMVGKLWGQTRILAKLREEGFGDNVTDSVCDYLEGVDMVSLCASLIDKKYGGVPSEKLQRDKLCAALYRHGYSPSEIRLAVARVSNG